MTQFDKVLCENDAVFFFTPFGWTKFCVRMTEVFLRLKPFRLSLTTLV